MRDIELRPQHVFDCALSILDSIRKLQYDKLGEAELCLSFLEPLPDGWFKLNVDAAVDSVEAWLALERWCETVMGTGYGCTAGGWSS